MMMQNPLRHDFSSFLNLERGKKRIEAEENAIDHATKETCKSCNNDWPENREYSDDEICEDCKREARENAIDKACDKFL